MTFFSPPRRIETSIFTRLPDQFRKPRRTAWADANQGGREIDSFLEGPSFDRQGRLYITDIPYGRIFRVSAAGAWELVSEYDGWPNGLKIHRDGRIFITDYKRGIMLLDPASGRVTPYLETAASESFKGVNDLVFDSKGNLYFTDQGQTGMHDPTGRVYRLRPNGQLDLLLANAPSPNGLALSPDEKVLYLAVTRGNAVWRVPLLEDGSVAKVGQFFTSYGPSGPDGMAVDQHGRVIVANPGLGYAWVLNPRAEPVIVLRSTEGMSLTNIAFGGAEHKTLYCTESVSGSILRADLDVPGLPIHRGQS